MTKSRIVTKDLTPQAWPDLVRLFGPRGACGGCWCMAWRLGRRAWEEGRGVSNRRRFRRLVTSGQAHGVVAYVDGEPVGWCSYDRRLDFVRLQSARSLRCDDADQVWSVPCFYVHPSVRGRGVAGKLLAHAVAAVRAHGGRIVEGYPVQDTKDGRRLPGAFAWTGTLSMFRRAGFSPVGNRGGAKERWRRRLRPRRAPRGRGRAPRS